MNKIFIVNKPSGITSFDVVYKVRRKFFEAKGGHCGTLDPFASGLMIVTLGEACKIQNYFLEQNKGYVATLKLGQRTLSLDTEGEVVEEKEVKEYSIDTIKEVLNSFLGDSYQTPPMYSSIRNNGVKLYELARNGIEVERKPRKIHIYSIKLLSYKDNIIEFYVSVSKGTYIRVLGEDIAHKLNTIGYLTSLKRVEINNFTLDNSKDIDKLEYKDGYDIKDLLPYKQIIVDEKTKIDIKNGKKIKLDCSEELVLLLDNNKTELALYRLEDNNIYKCERGFRIDGSY